jgi:hypothetical protein
MFLSAILGFLRSSEEDSTLKKREKSGDSFPPSPLAGFYRQVNDLSARTADDEASAFALADWNSFNSALFGERQKRSDVGARKTDEDPRLGLAEDEGIRPVRVSQVKDAADFFRS